MAASLNGKLWQLADEYYINYGSAEQKKIDASVINIKAKLTNYFGARISKTIEFGSYKRDTLLPRKYDEHSDVDLMVVFNHASIGVNPGTYRGYLINFAKECYSRSEFYKDAPTVVLELNHIKYDLVPAYEERYSLLFPGTTHIPQSDSSWMQTDPNGFNNELTRANTAHGSNIKKVIRLLKAWNAKVGYPLLSFGLEKEITAMNYLFCSNLQDYFFYAIDNLTTYRFNNATASQKIQALKDNAGRIRSYLNSDSHPAALVWLGHILPM